MSKLSIFVPKFLDFYFDQTLKLNKFEDINFKYNNGFFRILARKYPNKSFLS